MEPANILALASSLVLIGLIVWWFFMKPDSEVVTAEIGDNHQTINIVVSGGYTPSKVLLRKDVPAKLVFTRKDPSSCLEELVMPDFGLQRKLPLNEEVTIELTPDKAGRYTYSCGMHMFFGEVVVK